MATKEILTTFEAADICHVSYNTIKNWIKRGLINAYRTAGGHLRIKAGDLEALCREHSIPMDNKTRASLRKVLIVDDEENIREGLKETLRHYPEKFEIFTASDGFEAGQLVESEKPDLVILDLIMPGLDGFKVCQLIRDSDSLNHAKTIVLTGYPSDENCERAKKYGANICHSKPLDREALFSSIRELLDPRRGVRRRRRKPAGKKK